MNFIDLEAMRLYLVLFGTLCAALVIAGIVIFALGIFVNFMQGLLEYYVFKIKIHFDNKIIDYKTKYKKTDYGVQQVYKKCKKK